MANIHYKLKQRLFLVRVVPHSLFDKQRRHGEKAEGPDHEHGRVHDRAHRLRRVDRVVQQRHRLLVRQLVNTVLER